ncbi:hypothetical protein ACPDHL_07990 [Myroides sp. C15-4]|uniref:hypothetical protein n=1 Tax=Myroides sp. C15-4 TaxID=3400532 RepID=UPI003D2F66D7
MIIKNYRIIGFVIVFVLSSCKAYIQTYQIEYVDIKDYRLFNECLIDVGSIVTLEKDSLFIRNGEEDCKYSFFHEQNKLSVINNDMVIYFYLSEVDNENLAFITNWLPKYYMINWKEEYMKYKEDGVKIKLTKLK